MEKNLLSVMDLIIENGKKSVSQIFASKTRLRGYQVQCLTNFLLKNKENQAVTSKSN